MPERILSVIRVENLRERREIISFAALFVKVRSKIFSGRMPKFNRCEIRATMVLVLPVPALAIIRLCPNGAVAAVYCSAFRFVIFIPADVKNLIKKCAIVAKINNFSFKFAIKFG